MTDISHFKISNKQIDFIWIIIMQHTKGKSILNWREMPEN